ncbi:hypothetical protein [Mesorhizobium xinjiangense]|uniref:hypothetical protein n=1 Tax=Mesorhizobium xinjiangense TaxID=2678685 RepID=UPI0012ECCAC1|nr:hypothetical protein [Mesorhizobium xinjiangense]
MHWSHVAVAVVGLLLGFRFRAPALLAATAIIFIAATLIYGVDDTPQTRGLLSGLLLVITLQLAYLAGLLIAILWRRRDQRNGR